MKGYLKTSMQTQKRKNVSNKSQHITMSKEYSYSEIGQHNQESDLWMVIEGKVYDVTKFLDDHP